MSWIRWRGRAPSSSVCDDGQWRSSITTSTWLGSMPVSYLRSTSSKLSKGRRKVLQQLAEELRAEYLERKGAVAGGTRWAAAKQPPQQQQQQQQQQQTRTWRQCRSERAANGTKRRTLEMPQAVTVESGGNLRRL